MILTRPGNAATGQPQKKPFAVYEYVSGVKLPFMGHEATSPPLFFVVEDAFFSIVSLSVVYFFVFVPVVAP